MNNPTLDNHPLFRLDEEDLNMVTSFVLASGSIKQLASAYGVSYPTMRQRLDRLIRRLRQHVEGPGTDPLAEYLAELIEKGYLSVEAAKKIRDLHRQSLTGIDKGADAELGIDTSASTTTDFE